MQPSCIVEIKLDFKIKKLKKLLEYDFYFWEIANKRLIGEQIDHNLIIIMICSNIKIGKYGILNFKKNKLYRCLGIFLLLSIHC